MVHIRTAQPSDRGAICALLDESALPTGDLDTSRIEWLVAMDDDALIGTIGLEVFERVGLLRSLAVKPALRRAGIASGLVRELEDDARRRGIEQLVLLTQTAEAFFQRRGYARIERGAAPAALQDSAEFRALCPASATCMSKPLSRIKRVLFVCVENSNRSQMAEAFARIQGGASVDAASAGSRPSGTINPKAVRFMAELGYDLTRHRSKSLDEITGEFDAVVTMGCGDSCPWVAAKHRCDWNLPDPKHMADDDYRAVRDDIGARVRELLRQL